MKSAFFLFALVCPVHAELLATFETSRGSITTVLHHDKVPRTVANFITMAEGTRGRIHPTKGTVIHAPLYAGEKFFRVVNDPSFKIIQTGSGTGTNSGGPGFTFKDEFHPSLTHVPYVLSMANSGPNTNGSQIFFTGNTATPGLNGVHTVFGIVSDPASRAVIDSIVEGGSNTTTILSVSFSRTGAEAESFDEHAQSLPIIEKTAGQLVVNQGVSCSWLADAPRETGDVFVASRSTTLEAASWSPIFPAGAHHGLDAVATGPLVLDNATSPQAFYQLAVMRHPDALSPSRLAGRMVTVSIGVETLRYQFNAEGTGGSGTYTVTPNEPTAFTFLRVGFSSTAHAFTFSVQHLTGSPGGAFTFRVGCDSANAALISGRQTSYSGPSQIGSGPATVTR